MKTIYTNLWLLIAVGGVFCFSNSFMNVENDVKLYITSIATSVIVLLLSFTKKPLYYLKQSVTNKLFLYGLTFICFALSLQGFLQYVGVLSSNHYNFSITGSFENPAGFSAVLSLLFIAPAYITFDFNHEHRCTVRLICAISSLLAFVMILLCGSRSGILAVLATLSIMICHKTYFLQTLKKHKWLNLLFSLIIIALLFVLYHLKADSANGRLLIWRVCMDMIAERPLFGFGHGGFLANYMHYQAEYLSAHPNSPFIMLADNMNHPFNEYIKLTVEYGLIGLSLAVLLLYFIAKKIVRNGSAIEIGLSLIATVAIQCMFSYPFNYAVFTFLMLLLLLYVLPIKEPKQSKAYTGIRISISAITAMLLVYICFSCYNNMKWAEMSKRSLRGETEKMLPHYEKMMSVLGHNPYFLYNYSAELNYIGLYEESNTIAELCLKRMNDYDVQLLLADNYTNMYQYDKAIESYRTASVMVPSRFVPLEEIMDIYILQSDTAGAVQIAEEIMNKPVKVESATVDAIRRKAEELINKY